MLTLKSELNMAEDMDEAVAYSYLAQIHEYVEDILTSITN